MSSAEALHARTARAHEDPDHMTVEARIGFVAKHVRYLLSQNPDLDDRQLAKAVRLRIRDEMADLGRKSAAARARRRGESRTPLPLDELSPEPDSKGIAAEFDAVTRRRREAMVALRSSAQTVECPACGAETGESCRFPSGIPASVPHKVRREAASRAPLDEPQTVPPGEVA